MNTFTHCKNILLKYFNNSFLLKYWTSADRIFHNPHLYSLHCFLALSSYCANHPRCLMDSLSNRCVSFPLEVGVSNAQWKTIWLCCIIYFPSHCMHLYELYRKHACNQLLKTYNIQSKTWVRLSFHKISVRSGVSHLNKVTKLRSKPCGATVALWGE